MSMADQKNDSAKSEVKAEPKPDGKSEPKSETRAETKSEPKPKAPRGSMVNERLNMPDGKPERIANPRDTHEAYDYGDVDPGERSPFAPTPFTETNQQLDNRSGDQRPTPADWAQVPQQVDPQYEVDPRKLDNRE